MLRRSGADGSLVSRLWQRSPSRPVSDVAFSRPSSSRTTQPAGRADAAAAAAVAVAVGTRKPDRDAHEPLVGISLLYPDQI